MSDDQRIQYLIKKAIEAERQRIADALIEAGILCPRDIMAFSSQAADLIKDE